MTERQASTKRVAPQHRSSQLLSFTQKRVADMATNVLDFPHNPDTDGVAAFCPGILEVQGPLGVDMCNEGVGNEERGSNQIVVVAPSPSSREQAEMSGPAAVPLAAKTERCGFSCTSKIPGQNAATPSVSGLCGKSKTLVAVSATRFCGSASASTRGLGSLAAFEW